MGERHIHQIINKFPERIKEAYKIKVKKLDVKPKKIILVGMGGCYNAGLILKEILRDELGIPLEVSPGYSGRFSSLKKSSLIILVSYSGNTQEVIKFYNKLISENIKHNILVITSGGELLDLCKKNKTRLIELKSDLHQRFTFPYYFFALYKFFDLNFLSGTKELIVRDIIGVLKRNKEKIENSARNLAGKFRFKNPLVYGTNYYYPGCYRMQTSIEEDAKVVVHSNRITELFHNELEAIPASRFYPILVLDRQEANEFDSQIHYFRDRIKDYYEFDFYNYHREERMFLFIYFADYLGFYISKIKKTNMGKTPVSDEIKRQ
ncbi:SIS domain-containing protein [Candidatus Pacearchaeota archaeon]|nr:SIS domain-containing protein [Candidatus Pacearchaeota archaeon]